ncbi:integral membrane transporter [Streptomyces sp. C]|nr:integral membrane transporter [Streptomyces sp. C]
MADASSLVVSFGLVTLLAGALTFGAGVLRTGRVPGGAAPANRDEPAPIRP